MSASVCLTLGYRPDAHFLPWEVDPHLLGAEIQPQDDLPTDTVLISWGFQS